MKNILKNASLFIIAIIFTFGFSLNAFAEGPCGDLDSSLCRVGANGEAIYVAGNGNVQQLTSSSTTTWDFVSLTGSSSGGNPVNNYDAAGISNNFGGTWFNAYQGETSALFCLDAQYEGHKTLYAERFLMDSTTTSTTQAFDAAVMSILTANGGVRTITDIQDYFARLQAIRGLAYTFGYYKSTNIKYGGAHYAGLTNTSEWNKKNSTVLGELNSALAAAGQSSVGNVTATNYSYSGSAVDKAEQYYVEALKAATKYTKKSASKPSVTVGNATAGEITSVGTGVNASSEKEIVHTIKLSGFTKDQKFIINGLKLAEGKEFDNVTVKISKIEISGGQTFVDPSVALGQNLAEYIPENTDAEVKITVKVEGTGDSASILNCGIKYSIDGIYGTGAADEQSNYVATIWYSGVSKSQRFIGLEEAKEKTEDGIPWSSEYEDKCSCENLKDACIETGNPNSEECKSLQEANCPCDYLEAMCEFGDEESCTKFEEECKTTCNTDFTPMGACCDASDKLVISTSDEAMDPYEIHGNKKNEIKACFVTKVDNGAQPVDEKNNSYQMLTDSRVASNRFCSVNCREDYVMQLPSAKRVNAGRYFTFQTSIQATKQCYTNTIKRKEYKKIIDGLLRRIEQDATIYSDFYLAEEHAVPDDPLTFDTSCTAGGSCGPCASTGAPVTIENGGHTTPYIYTKIELSSFINKNRVDLDQDPLEIPTGGSHAKNSEVNYGTCSGGSSYYNQYLGKDVCVTCDATYATSWKEVTFAEFKQELHETWVAAEADYYAAIEELKQVTKEYNECSEWETEYNPQPDVTYDYDETEYRAMANMPVPMNGQMSASTTNYEHCNLDWSLNQDSVSVDNEYNECRGGSGFGGKVTDNLKYTECTLAGGNVECHIDPYTMHSAIYRKSKNESKGTYIPQDLFYNIYPSGEISVESGDDRVLLEQKLPVKLSRRLGIYQYYIKFTNIGEYYSNGEQGRFMGNNGIIQDSEYICAYLVNIPEQEFYCNAGNIPKCEGPDCVSNCIGPNCDALNCDGTNCIADCVGVGCIYDEDASSSILEKLVSLNNLFPNGTNSYNWDKTRNDKALATIAEIEEKGNAIYDEEPILSITIDPTAAREIRKYNDSVINNGGYSNSTISCDNRNGYQEIVCYSSFIDDLLDGEYGNIVNANSLIADDTYRHSENSEYFDLWGNRISEDDMLGPSWK